MPPLEAVYGRSPAALATVTASAIQTSPLIVGSTPLEALEDGSVARMVIAAPPGTVERRYVLARALRALAPAGELVALAPKDMGGSRLGAELKAFGCAVVETAKRHQRLCRCVRPVEPIGLEAAIVAGGLQRLAALGLWTQPGVFSWNRLDPGSAVLVAQPWTPSGAGVDLGCGVGVLARAVLASAGVTELTLIDLDRRALDAARRNLDDPRLQFLQHDLRRAPRRPRDLDFAIMNPPFHDGGAQDRQLGQAFVATAADMLKPGGVLRLVANVALPYETLLAARFAKVTPLARAEGYKVLEAWA
ncbi:MAG TPA: methyltransferase [Caulobacteraceae bacterium]|jgi:16S rRNA (guanine1207-N2)-methyltransferase